MFANEGIPNVIVTLQSLAGNFGFLHGPFDEESSSVERWELEPVWDTDARSVAWRKGSLAHSPREVVQAAMEALQAVSR
jgi:hypothetical protein